MNQEEMQVKISKLDYAREELKKHFIGLDNIIDEIIAKISPWYIMPELIERPLIVCLWGMTGVGKTDLVRKLVTALDIQDKYQEIQMTIDKFGGNGITTIEEALRENQNIEVKQPYILLLDEIQRFRSIEKDGSDNHSSTYNDIWELLSDGKLKPQYDLNTLMSMIFSFKKYSDLKENPEKLNKKEEEEASDYLDYRFGDDYHSAKRLKSILTLSEDVTAIMAMSPEEKFQRLMYGINSKSIYEHKDYTKGLIFISGNLDEAYSVANSAEDVDFDADIYHNITKKINVIDIKEALQRRFKPEQIARFGNNNIIYPSLTKNSFNELIRRKSRSICDKIKEKTNIDIEIDNSVYKLIYNNGVFPVQGTRPVFSTITDIIERNLLRFVYTYLLEERSGSIKIIYENETLSAINIGKNNEVFMKIPYIGDIDLIRNKNRKDDNRKYGIAVHEAGHALIYSLLFGVAPPQIVAVTTNNNAAGFVALHKTDQTKDMIVKQVLSLYGGGAAEEMVFGEKYRSAGVSLDFNKATDLVGHMIRKWGMYDYKSTIAAEDADNDSFNCDLKESNKHIEVLCTRFYNESKKILTENKDFFIDIVNELVNREIMSSEEFTEICKRHGHKIDVKESDEVLFSDVKDSFNKWRDYEK